MATRTSGDRPVPGDVTLLELVRVRGVYAVCVAAASLRPSSRADTASWRCASASMRPRSRLTAFSSVLPTAAWEGASRRCRECKGKAAFWRGDSTAFFRSSRATRWRSSASGGTYGSGWPGVQNLARFAAAGAPGSCPGGTRRGDQGGHGGGHGLRFLSARIDQSRRRLAVAPSRTGPLILTHGNGRAPRRLARAGPLQRNGEASRRQRHLPALDNLISRANLVIGHPANGYICAAFLYTPGSIPALGDRIPEGWEMR